MATIKPRVAVTLEPQTHEVIQRLAILQGRTRGSVIADLLDSVVPSLTRTVALLEAAASAPDEIKKGLKRVVDDVHTELLIASGSGSQSLDIALRGGSGEGVNPHVVTRGSGHQKNTESVAQEKGRSPLKPRVSGTKAEPKAE